jgi:hypothetical protein
MSRQFSPTTSVLDMFGAILAAAGRWLPGAAVEVIPIVATDLLTDLPLIEQIARHAGAPVLIANSGTKPAVDGVEPSDALNVIRTVVEAAAFPLGRLTIVSTAKDRVAARLEDELLPTNPGLRNVLGAISSLADANVGGQRLAVIAYDESNIDKASREALRQIIMKDIPTCGAAMPRTLLIVIGNEQVTPEHLDAEPSVRYILRPSGLLQRHSREVDEREIADLGSGSDPLILFLGAGSSYASGLPLGDSLRNEALTNFFPDDSAASLQDLVSKFFRWVVDEGRLLTTEENQDEQYFIDNLTLERVLREEKHRVGTASIPATLRAFAQREEKVLKTPSEGILALRNAISLRKKIVVVTVNFDRLVESGDPGRFAVMASDQQFAEGLVHLKRYLRSGRGAVPLLKLHGSIEDPSTIVADVETTALGLSGPRAEAIGMLVGTPVAPCKWTYVGYSMRDPDIIAELRSRRFVEGTNERWVAPTADPTVEDLVNVSRIPFWQALGVPMSLHERSVSVTAETFYKQLLNGVRVK